MIRRIVAALALAALAGAARAQPPPGTPVAIAAVAGLAGGSEELQPKDARVSVVVFLRPGQERSKEALLAIAACQEKLAGKSVRWLAVFPADADPAQASADVTASRARLALGRDEADKLYGELLLRMHPVVAILEKGRRISAVVSYQAVDYSEVLTVRIRRALGEATDAEVAAVVAPNASALPGDGDQVVISQRNLSYARKLLAEKKYAGARTQVQRALEVAPSADAWALQGQLEAAQGKCPEALRAFDAALRLDAKQAEALAGKARCP
jgi:tetratricopeptide (TPR) repeat protein